MKNKIPHERALEYRTLFSLVHKRVGVVALVHGGHPSGHAAHDVRQILRSPMCAQLMGQALDEPSTRIRVSPRRVA